MNYYQLGEQVMPIMKNMFSSVEKFTASILTGLASLYAPVYVPICALAAIIIVSSIYECKANKKCGFNPCGLKQAKKMSYKLRDSIVAICGAFTIEKFIVTSIELHAVEFIAGAFALVEFWELLKNLSTLHPEWKIWSLLSKTVKKKGEQYLDVKLDDILSDDVNNIKSS